MKTVQVRVRITVEQEKELERLSALIPGSSVSGLVQQAVDLWLEIEGPVYEATFDQLRKKLHIKRQDVARVA